MNGPSYRAATTAAVTGLCVALSGLGFADEPGAKPSPPQTPEADPAHQRVSGVVIKVEHPEDGGRDAGENRRERHKHRRARLVTINTAAEWRDYVRDQAPETRKRANRRDAEKGRKGIASEGEPVAADNLVVVDADPDTVMEVRFRASDDETSPGSATPGKAASDEKQGGPGRNAEKKAARLRPNELKSGLFVEVQYKKEDGCNKAGRLTVIKPVGGPNTPASEPDKKAAP